MSSLDFETMSKADLRAYVLAHPEDQEGFYALVDRLHTEPSRPLKSLEDLEQLPEVQRAKQKRLGEQARQSENSEV
jgi:hypothetical protein